MRKSRNAVKRWVPVENSNSVAAPKVLEKGDATAEVKKPPTIAERVEESKILMCEMLGVEDPELAEALITQAKQLEGAMSFGGSQFLEMATAMLLELKPKNLSQALLAVQMCGVHHAALLYIKRAGLVAQTTLNSEGHDADILLAMRFMRMYVEQVETMAKLKGKGGQQRVTVKHVHVHKGGQAIVGAVTAVKHEKKDNGNRTNPPSKIKRLAEKREPIW